MNIFNIEFSFNSPRKTLRGMSGFVLALLVSTGVGFSSGAIAQEAVPDDAAKVTYDDNIQPLFRQRCSSCHSADRRSGDLDVTSYSNLMQGGASGTVIEPGDIDFSYLYSLVTHSEEPKMPPGNQPIPQNEIDLIAAWINGGALENKGSKAVIKKKVDMTIVENPTAQPAVVPIPARTVLEPVIQPAVAPNADAIATSPWAPIVALGGQRQVLLYNTQNGNLIGVIPFDDGQVNSLRFSRNGNLLAIGGGKAGLWGKVLVWDLIRGEALTTVGKELDAVLACDISPDQSMVVMGGPEKVVKVFSTETGELLYELAKHTDWVTAVEFSPDGALLVSGDRNGGLHTWEAMTGREYMTLKGHTNAISAVSWRSDSNIVASSSEDMTVRLWELNGGTQIKSWNGHGVGTLSIEFTRDGRLASCGRDKLAKLWDQNGQQLIAFPAMNDVASDVSFCDETNRVIAGAFGGQVSMWKVEDGLLAQEFVTKPLPLDQRLAQSNQELTQQAAALQQAVEKLNAAKATYDDVQAKLTAVTTQRQTADAAMQEVVAKVISSSTVVTAAEAERSAVNEQLQQSNAALPLVEESLVKLKDAAGKSPTDASLQQSVTVVASQAETMKAKNVELTTQMEAAISKLNAASEVVTQGNTEIEAAKGAIATMDQEIAEKTQQLVPTKAALDAATSEHTVALEAHVDATAQVELWTNEVAFKQQMEALQTQLHAANDAKSSSQLVVDSAQQKMAEAKAAVDAANKELAEKATVAQTVEDQIKAARQPVNSVQPVPSENQ